MQTYLRRIETYISSNNLLEKTGKHIVALSGGADSVCLLLVMKQLGYDVHAAHCNFHLRGNESDRDESFCELLCNKEGIPFHRAHFDTKAYAALHHVSIEMAARELRYNYFEQLRLAIDAQDILVAHHEDDSVETFLMNILRGTGIHGMQGIKPRNGHIVRPLLCVKRQEIESWLKTQGQDYVTDSTNLENDVVRNKIRLDVIPALKNINPSAVDSIQKTITRMNEAVKVFDNAMEEDVLRVTGEPLEMINKKKVPIYIDIKKLLALPSSEYALFTILSPYGFSPSQIESIMHLEAHNTGKRWLAENYQLLADRGTLQIAVKRDNDSLHIVIPEPGNYIVREYEETPHANASSSTGTPDIKVVEKLRIKDIGLIEDGFVCSRQSHCINIDAEKVKFPLVLRNTIQGDRFIPFGMKGSKLISDYLTDRKKTIIEKENTLVLCDANGMIVWIIGERFDDRFKITSETSRCLEVSYTKEH